MYTFSTLSSLSPFLLTTYFFFFLFRYPPSSTLFPYTTLFRSVHQGTDNSHGDRTNSQVGFLSDRCEGKPGFDEAKQLFLYVAGDGFLTGILYLTTVYTKYRQAFLVVRRLGGRQIHRSRALTPVKTPDRFGIPRVHIHGLGPIAPAGRHGKGQAHAFPLKFFSGPGCFCYPANTTVCDHTFHRSAVGMTYIFCY